MRSCRLWRSLSKVMPSTIASERAIGRGLAAYARPLFDGQAVHEKAAALCNSIVKPSCNAIGLVGLPINAMAIREPGLVHDGSDQRRADSATPGIMTGKEVLEIADRGDGCGASMKKIVDKPNQLSVGLRN